MSLNDEYYTQCELRSGKYKDVAWIPSCFAEIGKMLLIDGYKNGWTVTQVFTTEKKEIINLKSRDYLKQREASDI